MPDQPQLSPEDGARALCRACRRMARAGLIAGRAGNLSLRLGDRVLVTPRGTNKARLRPAAVIRAELRTRPEAVEGASVEYRLHHACYLAAPQAVGAVIHTHAPALTAIGLLGLDLTDLPEAAANLGGVARVPFLPSGSEQLARAVGTAVADGAGIILLTGHGVVAVAPDIEEAADRMELAELSAKAVVMARTAGWG